MSMTPRVRSGSARAFACMRGSLESPAKDVTPSDMQNCQLSLAVLHEKKPSFFLFERGKVPTEQKKTLSNALLGH